jgi:chitodextrinase
MVDFVKVKGQEISVTTANTVGDAVLVRVYAPSATVLTFANTGGTTGTYSMGANMDEVFVKEATDTIAATVAVKCVAIAYK